MVRGEEHREAGVGLGDSGFAALWCGVVERVSLPILVTAADNTSAASEREIAANVLLLQQAAAIAAWRERTAWAFVL